MPRQTEMTLIPAGRGGWRPGAGRKPRPGARVLHRTRPPIPGHCPVHVTVRLRRGIPSLRKPRFVNAFQRSLAKACTRPGFRVVHYSIQANHLHFLVEAQGKHALGCGMKSLAARVGRCVNRVYGRSGPALDGRYHHRLLKTPREVRHALAYVLLNARHHFQERHGRAPPQVRLDRASSAVWFDGWRKSASSGPAANAPPAQGRPLQSQPMPTKTRPIPAARTDHGAAAPARPRETATPRTWLLARGWRKHRLIDPAEVPGRR